MKFFLLLCFFAMITLMCQAQVPRNQQQNSRRQQTYSNLNSQPLPNTRRTFPMGGYGYGGLGGGVGAGVDAGIHAGIDAGIGAGVGAGVGAGGYGYGGLGAPYGGYPYYG